MAVTVLLFAALLGWVGVGIVVGAMSVMLSDSGTPGVSWFGVLLAVVGVPVTVIGTWVIALVAAVRADGTTFYYPLVALGLGTVAAALVWLLGYAIVVLNLRLFGTDADRRRRPPRPSREQWRQRRQIALPPLPPAAPAPAHDPDPVTVFRYTAIHRIPDGGMTIEVGIEQHTGRRYLRTPMPQRGGEYDEYHGIDVATYATFGTDPDAARRFAAQCRQGLHRKLWLPPAGFPALTPIPAGSTRLAGKIATLLTDRPTTAAGAPVAGLPLGTPFVVITDQAVDSNGDLAVRLPGTTDPAVRVAAHHLGRS